MLLVFLSAHWLESKIRQGHLVPCAQHPGEAPAPGGFCPRLLGVQVIESCIRSAFFSFVVDHP